MELKQYNFKISYRKAQLSRQQLQDEPQTDKQVGNDIGDQYDHPSTSHEAAIAAAKRDAASVGKTSSLNKAQFKLLPVVMEGVDDVCLMMQSIENIVDLEKVEARASVSGVLRLYAAYANTFCTIVNWLESEQYEFHCYQLKEDRPYRKEATGGELKVIADKCKFYGKELQYLANRVTDQGIETDPEKVAAIAQLKSPRCIRGRQIQAGRRPNPGMPRLHNAEGSIEELLCNGKIMLSNSMGRQDIETVPEGLPLQGDNGPHGSEMDE
ncbi:GM12992 [Drosophila sechellia]|uniref:GM12992 n=1 Tax=Drosophila sechellia TaxID=7238 RepID=B4IMN4_DROSE|nr:GM12992 [Drosophila sechellia]